MQLPNGDQAIVDIIKLRAYCLNTDFPRVAAFLEPYAPDGGW